MRMGVLILDLTSAVFLKPPVNCSNIRKSRAHMDGLVQERCNSIANALELHLSCTNRSILWSFDILQDMVVRQFSAWWLESRRFPVWSDMVEGWLCCTVSGLTWKRVGCAVQCLVWHGRGLAVLYSVWFDMAEGWLCCTVSGLTWQRVGCAVQCLVWHGRGVAVLYSVWPDMAEGWLCCTVSGLTWQRVTVLYCVWYDMAEGWLCCTVSGLTWQRGGCAVQSGLTWQRGGCAVQSGLTWQRGGCAVQSGLTWQRGGCAVQCLVWYGRVVAVLYRVYSDMVDEWLCCTESGLTWQRGGNGLFKFLHCGCLMVGYIGLILGLCPANERWCYFVTTYLIGWAQTCDQPWLHGGIVYISWAGS